MYRFSKLVSRVHGRSTLGATLRAPLRALPSDMVVRILGGPIRGMRWIRGAYVNGCWVGTYEQDKAEAFKNALRPDSVVWDIGANVGYYTLIAGQEVTEGIVHAFEPIPRNAALLARHISLNRLTNIVQHNYALGTDNTPVAIRMGTTAGSSSLEGAADLAGHGLAVGVHDPATVLKAGAAPPTVVKMDVEGLGACRSSRCPVRLALAGAPPA